MCVFGEDVREKKKREKTQLSKFPSFVDYKHFHRAPTLYKFTHYNRANQKHEQLATIYFLTKALMNN